MDEILKNWQSLIGKTFEIDYQTKGVLKKVEYTYHTKEQKVVISFEVLENKSGYSPTDGLVEFYAHSIQNDERFKILIK